MANPVNRYSALMSLISNTLEFVAYSHYPSQRESESSSYDAHCEYLDDNLANAAKRYVMSIDELPENEKPVGWNDVKVDDE
jgi:hypothetical protein